MAQQIRKRKCRHCHDFFLPDPRNVRHQRYCTKPECRKASKAASREKWLSKEENRRYFHGPVNVERVQQWRKAHPGYWRPKPSEEPLQDVLSEKAEENPPIAPPKTSSPNPPLQDLLSSQPAVLIGLIAHLTGSALQDEIAFAARRLQQLGADILYGPTQTKGESHDPKAPHPAGAHPNGPPSVQLGGSAPGP